MAANPDPAEPGKEEVDLTKFGVMLLVVFTWLWPDAAMAAKKKAPEEEKLSVMNSGTFAGLAWRGIGPALTSGRISDLAVHPQKRHVYYVAVASGGVFKTENNGTTFEPLFDSQGSYSVGCVTLDPNNPFCVWVGTGENNSQRSVSYGDGVYRSMDGGKSWENMGLKESEHIGKILVDPRDSNVVFVAAQGPLWNSGGDRGLYKSTDGGQNWRCVLEISPDTGVTDVVMDPRNPDWMLAASYQRRRHVWTLINGGPESALYRSMDGGETWSKVENGLPTVDLGRIGLAISPANPDVVYALVEAAQDKGGFFRSVDRGASWSKMGDYNSQSPQYYQELVADPVNVDCVYSMDTWMHVTLDGGKTFKHVGEKDKHVDNHCMWIDPQDTDYLLAGCDGGIYESYDRGQTWEFKANLPVTQFYKGAVDNSEPFYYIYGGTQDNFSLGGPSQTTHVYGISNREWFVTLGGDGFQSRVDPQDPDTVYSQLQHGVLVRFDRRTGERVAIKPLAQPGEPPLRWNWDSPLIISPHQHTRLYFAANRVFRSDDRGQSWKAVSPDLTRQMDRNKLEVMGRVWGIDAVSKNASTSYYGNIVSLAESPLQEGLIYAGTDDGLIQVTEDGGKTWRKIDRVPGVPEYAYVSRLETCRFNTDTVFAAFDLHKMGDFKPYLMRSDDRGTTWIPISGDLPDNGTVYALAQDFVKPDLLFCGTEFGAFFSVNGGEKWIQLKSGMPTIAVRDLSIQERETDLVASTFGRGFFILDDYSPLRQVSEATLDADALLFPVKDARIFVPDSPLGLDGKAFQGASFYIAPNPPFGATFSYFLKEDLKSLQEKRREADKKAAEQGKDVAYPSWEALEKEHTEPKPELVFTVTDDSGNTVRILTCEGKAGLHRITWDLRFAPQYPVSLQPADHSNPFADSREGSLVTPGAYQVSMARRVNGQLESLGDTKTFQVIPLTGLPAASDDLEALIAFQRKVADLQRAVLGAQAVMRDAQNRLDHIKAAVDLTSGLDPDFMTSVLNVEQKLRQLKIEMNGEDIKPRYNEPGMGGISDRVGRVVYGQFGLSGPPTKTHLDAYGHAEKAFGPWLESLTALVQKDLAGLEATLEKAKAPYTPGRIPTWP